MVETRRRTLELSLKARNLSQSAFSAVERSLKRIREAGSRAFQGIVRAARSARGQILGIVAAVGGAQKLIIEPAAFEASLARITIAGEEFAEKTNEIRNVIEELATSTGTSRDELAEGFEAAAKRVKTFEEAVLLVSEANKLAAVSGGSVIDAVTGLDSVIENFGGSIAEVDQIAAKLFETTRRLPESQGEILTQLGNIAPQARLAGLELDDLLAAVATAEQRGVKASATFTALRTILDQIVSPTGAAEDKFAALGVRTGEAALAGQNMGEVFARVIDNADGLGIKLGDLGLRGRSVNAFLAIGAEQGRAFGETLEGIATTSVPEFQAAFDRVNNTTDSSIKAFGELAKVAASAFAGGYLDEFGAKLGDASRRVEEVRRIAEIAGLTFRQWVERIRPSIAVARLFFEAVDNGLAFLRTGVEGFFHLWRFQFTQIRAAALETFLKIADTIDEFVRRARAALRRLGIGDVADDALEQSRKELEARAEQITVLIAKVRGGVITLEQVARRASARGDEAAVARLNGVIEETEAKIRDLEAKREEVLTELANSDTNAGLRAAADRARQEADRVSEELYRSAQERMGVLQNEGQDVIDAFSDIGRVALESEENVQDLEERIRALQRALEELQNTPTIATPVEEATKRVREQAETRAQEPPAPNTTPDNAESEEKARKSAETTRNLKKGLEELQSAVAAFESRIEGAFVNSFAGFISGAQSAKEAARNFFTSVLDGFAQLQAKRLSAGLGSLFGESGVGGIVGSITSFFGGTPGTPTAVAADGGVIPVQPFAAGGMIRSASDSPVVRAFAAGGPFSRGLPAQAFGRAPDLGLFAEAGMPEGIVALPDGESVPLRLDSGGKPVVALPGGRTIPVRVRGDGMSDEEAAQQLMQSVRDGGGAVAPIGAAGGVLRRPTLAEIPEGGPALAAIPLPTGEAVPVRVRKDGTTVVELPKGRSLPTTGVDPARRFRGPRVPVREFAFGGMIRQGFRTPKVRAFAEGGAITPIVQSAIRSAQIPTSTAIRPNASGGVAVGDSYNVQIQALDGASVERILSSPEGRRTMESAFRQATRTRRDLRR